MLICVDVSGDADYIHVGMLIEFNAGISTSGLLCYFLCRWDHILLDKATRLYKKETF